MPNHLFDQLVSIGRLSTDYQDGGGDAVGPANAALDEALDVDIGVAVEFEEDEEEEDSDYDLVQEEGDGPELNGNGAMQMGGGIDEDDAGVETNDGLMLNVRDIDAYWLQRKISQAYEKIDPQHCQKLAEDVLKILTEGGDDSDVENRLQGQKTKNRGIKLRKK